MYKGFLIDKAVLKSDPHFSETCSFCHNGNEQAQNKDDAHKELVKRPSDDLSRCGKCHEDIAEKYKNSLHYTTAGLRKGICARLSDDEIKIFDKDVFQNSCRSCHASCGDCHVKGPKIGNITTGLIKGHQFVKSDQSRTCGFCHGGRVYPEFTGQYGVVKDAHFEKNMMCLDCHKKDEFHGDGTAYTSRKDVKSKPQCVSCHPAGEEKNEKAKLAHEKHKEKLSCTACHALSTYKNCYNCHLGKGSESKSGFFLGLNPGNKSVITTLRVVPTVRDTFKTAGINMKKYDEIPNYFDTVPHVIRKNTERTNNCNMCHLIKMGFLTKTKLIEGGSKANEELIYTPQGLKTGN